MTETPTTETDAQHTDSETRAESADPPNGNGDGEGRSLAVYAQWATFAILVLVALIATLQFYFSASAAIDTFVTPRYRPLFRAGFNLAVLLGCGIGLSVLVRRLA